MTSGKLEIETLELDESGGTTIVRTTTLHKTVENRDGHVGGGMEAGMTEGYATDNDIFSVRGTSSIGTSLSTSQFYSF